MRATADPIAIRLSPIVDDEADGKRVQAAVDDCDRSGDTVLLKSDKNCRKYGTEQRERQRSANQQNTDANVPIESLGHIVKKSRNLPGKNRRKVQTQKAG
jgi:hypothetical protein